MDQTTAWLLALVILVIAFGVYLRRRYGNLYVRLSDAMERATGIGMATIVRAIGVLTLAVWVAVYALSGAGPETGLGDLFGWLVGRSEGGAQRP